MELIKQILASFEGTLPKDSKTAAAVARGASPEEISACATEEGLHALAGALFEACEEGAEDGHLDNSERVTRVLAERIKEYRQGLPPACETARLIDAGASLEAISAAAEKEGLNALATMLFEAEQEQGKDSA